MRYRKLTSDGDFSFGASALNFWIDSPDGVAQAVETRLRLWLGEWYLNLEEGTPYMQGIIGKHSKESADTVIQDRVLNTQGVLNYENYESSIDPDTRIFSVSLTLNTIYGPTPLEVNNYVNL